MSDNTQTGRHSGPIEITPEMIEAARNAWLELDERWHSNDEILANICKAVIQMIGSEVRGVDEPCGPTAYLPAHDLPAIIYLT